MQHAVVIPKLIAFLLVSASSSRLLLVCKSYTYFENATLCFFPLPPQKKLFPEERSIDSKRIEAKGKNNPTKTEFTVSDYVMKEIEHEMDDLKRKTLMCKNFSSTNNKQIMDHFASDHFAYAVDAKLRSLMDILEVIEKKSQIKHMSTLKRIRAKSLCIRREAKNCAAWKNFLQNYKCLSTSAKTLGKKSVATQIQTPDLKDENTKSNLEQSDSNICESKTPAVSDREKDDKQKLESMQWNDTKGKSQRKSSDRSIPSIESSRWRSTSKGPSKKARQSYYQRSSPYSYESHQKEQDHFSKHRWMNHMDPRRGVDANYVDQYPTRALLPSDKSQTSRFRPGPSYEPYQDAQPLLRQSQFSPHYENSLDQNRYFNTSRDYNNHDMFKF